MPVVVGGPSTTQTLLLLSLFIICLFPDLFQLLILKLPLTLLTFPFALLQSPKDTLSAVTRVHIENPNMSWFQKTITMPSRARGSYLITESIVNQLPELKNYKVGILHLFVQHTSCGLSMNENWDSDVRADMSDALDRIVPSDTNGKGLYRHSAEGDDDMPAHVKSALVGSSVTIPISNGKLATGTWQGIWLLEFRTAKHSRKIVATIQGEKA